MTRTMTLAWMVVLVLLVAPMVEYGVTGAAGLFTAISHAEGGGGGD